MNRYRQVLSPDYPLDIDDYYAEGFQKDVFVSAQTPHEAGLEWYNRFVKQGVEIPIDGQEDIVMQDVDTGEYFVIAVYPVSSHESHVVESYPGEPQKRYKASFDSLTPLYIRADDEGDARLKALHSLVSSLQREIETGQVGIMETKIEEVE